MASNFWGGFAKTVLGDMNAQDADKRALEQYKQKKTIDLDFETTEVDDVDQAGNPVKNKINSKGVVVSSRKLSVPEVEARQLAKRELLAKINGAEATAEVAGKQADNYDEDRRLALEDKDRGRKLQEGQLAYQNSSLDSLNEDRKLRHEDATNARTDRKEANSAETFAAKSLHELTLRAANVPGAGSRKNNIISGARAGIKAVLDSNKSEPEKKRIIQNMLDSINIHLPSYGTISQPDSSGGLESR